MKKTDSDIIFSLEVLFKYLDKTGWVKEKSPHSFTYLLRDQEEEYRLCIDSTNLLITLKELSQIENRSQENILIDIVNKG